jgi:hypothetical protein
MTHMLCSFLDSEPNYTPDFSALLREYLSVTITSHIVERWREILLWSWVVGRLGGLQGEWRSNVERMTAWSELGGISRGQISSDVNVVTSARDTLDEEVVNRALGRKTTGSTSYVFCETHLYLSFWA